MKLFRSVVLMITFIILSACSSPNNNLSENESNKNINGGDLKIAVSAQPPILDPQITTAIVGLDITRNIFETLVTIDESFQPVPMLAESIDISDDGKIYTFKLRKGVLFHNGNEMTSEDVVASMERWLKTSSQAMATIKGAKFKSTDTYEVELELKERAADVLDTMASIGQVPAIMPKEVIESSSEEGITEYIGTGPFKFEEWKQDQYIHLSKFDDYVAVDEKTSGYAGKKEALVDNLYYYFVPDPSTRLAGLQTGEYHIADSLPHNNYDQLKSMSDVETYYYYNGTLSAFYNKKEGLMSDSKMRQAVNAALDMDQIMLASFANEDFYTLDSNYLNFDQVNWANNAGEESYNQADPEKAEKLMKEAGYDGKEIRMMVSRDYDFHYNAAVVVQEQLQRAGANVKLEVFDWATLLDRRDDASSWDIFFTSIAYAATPSLLMEINPSYPGWTEHPKIEELTHALRTAESQEEAKAYWEELQGFLWNEYVPTSLLGHNTVLFAATNKLKGFKPFRGIVPWNTAIAE